MLDDNYLYTAFNYARARTVSATGLTIPPNEPYVYAFTRDQLAWDNEQANCLKTRLKEVATNPGIAVYDGTHLVPGADALSDFGYRFKRRAQARNALSGIVRIILP